MTLACEDANSKLVDVETVAGEDRVGNNLLQIWKLKFDHKAKCLSQVEHKVWSRFEVEVHKILKLRARRDFEAVVLVVSSVFCC